MAGPSSAGYSAGDPRRSGGGTRSGPSSSESSPSGASASAPSAEPPGVPTSWWCDVAGKGCLRPVEGLYPAKHRCWANGDYMVCSSCYEAGEGVQNKEQLVLQP